MSPTPPYFDCEHPVSPGPEDPSGSHQLPDPHIPYAPKYTHGQPMTPYLPGLRKLDEDLIDNSLAEDANFTFENARLTGLVNAFTGCNLVNCLMMNPLARILSIFVDD